MKRAVAILLLVVSISAHARMDDAKLMFTRGQYAEAIKEYEKYADRGFPEAHFMLAVIYANGQGVPRDTARAIRYATVAAEKGSLEGIALIALLYDSDKSGIRDSAAALRWLHTGADKGDRNSLRFLGLRHLTGDGVPKDFKQAHTLFSRSAKDGDPGSMFELGKMHEFGIGVPKNEVLAKEWYVSMRRQYGIGSAEVKHMAPMYVRLAGLMEKNPVRDGDLRDAADMFQRAAEHGHREAMYRLGKMYEEGRGVAASPEKALAHYELAGDRGEAAALYRGGLMFRDGRGVKQSDAEALSWLLEAAGHGHAPAMRAAGRLLESGAPTAEDQAAAMDWYCKAAIADGTRLSAISLLRPPSPAEERFLVAQVALLERCAASKGTHGAAAKALTLRLSASATPAVMAQGHAMASSAATAGAMLAAE